MSQLTYTGPLEGVQTPDGATFPKGVPVDVTDAQYAALLVQDFTDPAATAAAPVIQPAASFTAAPAVEAPANPADPGMPVAQPVVASTPAAPTQAPTDPASAAAPAPAPTVLAPVSGVTA